MIWVAAWKFEWEIDLHQILSEPEFVTMTREMIHTGFFQIPFKLIGYGQKVHDLKFLIVIRGNERVIYSVFFLLKVYRIWKNW